MPPKRKRVERNPSDAGSNRPSPHRPAETSLGQHDRNNNMDSPRGGRGGRPARRTDRRDSYTNSNSAPASAPSNATNGGPISPTQPRRPSLDKTATATPAIPATPTSPVQSSFDYAVITSDRIARWSRNGREEVLQHGIQSRIDGDATEMAIVFQELFHSVVDLRLGGADAGTIVKEIVGPPDADNDGQAPAFDTRTLFLDTVSVEAVTCEYHHGQLRDFMIATEISPMLMREVLDFEFLRDIGLVRPTFAKVGIRLSTNLLYRQANFNLLREETEGYSKLATDLFNTAHREMPYLPAVRRAFERVKGLIGTFDLDVGRVLDVTLDVTAAILVARFRFFVKLLRVSSWWPRSQIEHATRTYTGGLPPWAFPDHDHYLNKEEDEAWMASEQQKRDVAFWDRAREAHLDAFFELGGRQVVTADDLDQALQPTDNPELDAERTWIAETKTLRSPGNRVAAQLLGFKIRFYASEARDADDVLPANLLYCAALLIKIGFVSLPDLWAHLWPLDENMGKIREKRMAGLEEEERAKRPGGAVNALTRAGALPDDTAPGPARSRDTGSKPEVAEKAAKEKEDDTALPDPLDQKVPLLEQLLTIGAIPEALFIIGRHDWMLEAYPDKLYPLIHRIIHHSIEKVFQASQAKPGVNSTCAPKPMPDLDQTGVPKGKVKLTTPVPKKQLRWPFPDDPDHHGQAYRFYWDEWADNVPVCQTADDVFTLCSTFLNISGVNIGRDPPIIIKLCTIGTRSLAEDRSEHNFARWQDLLRRVLVPALSLTEANTAAVSAVWALLNRFSTAVRYKIYSEWYEGPISRLKPIKAAFDRTRVETMGYMKRLSLENIPQMARALAKAAFSSPGVVFKVALDQIESYSNLIQVFVECAKYYTDLGYDVLLWSLLRSLGGKQRSRTQETSVLLTSKWLQALSRFSGAVFKRYSVMDPWPILQYVNTQLYRGNSTDLVILTELISAMGGVVSDVDFNDAQLRAMTGGEVLRREVLRNLGDKREESARSSARLMKALVDTKLAGQLLVNIAQYRQSAIYKVSDDEAHIKFLATMVDDAHQVFVQYLDLLRSNVKAADFDAIVPDVVQLIRDYGLDAGLAFMVGRASLIYRIINPKALSPPSSPGAKAATPQVVDNITPDTDGDVAMETAAPDDKVTAEKDSSDTPAPVQLVNGRKLDPFFDPLRPIIEAMPDLIPKAGVWDRISPEFYAIFWTLQLGDLTLPQESYSAEHLRLRKQAEDVMKDRSDMTRAGMNRKDQKKRELLNRADAIHGEMKQHLERYSKTKVKLTQGAALWFPGALAKVDSTSDAILEQCLLPRLHLSAIDAEYCFRMVKFLHESQAPNFKLMSLYDRLFNQNRLRSLIFECTVREAEHLARFLKCILGELSEWHRNKDLYEKEALGSKIKSGVKTRTYLGFATELGDDGKPTAFVEHDSFRDLLFRWHKNLNTALRSCLGGMEWMHIRNAITVLKTVIDFFPAITFMADKFLEQLKTITERESASKTGADTGEGHRVDLSVTAQTAFSELQKRKSKWILVQAFRPGTTGDEPRQSTAAGTALRPSAPEFRPGRPLRNGEVEDGEVKGGRDGKDKKTAPSTGPASLPTKPSVPARQPPKESSNGPPSRPSVDSRPGSRPSTPKPPPTTTITNSTARSEAPRPSPLSSAHGLPSRPELPARPPDVPFAGRYRPAPNPNERREPLPPRDAPRDPRESRETRDHREPHPRDVREPRDNRDLRDSRPSETSRQERHEIPDRPERPDTRADRQPDHQRTGDRRGQDTVSREPPPRPAERTIPVRPEPPPRWKEPVPGPERDGRTLREARPASGVPRGPDGRMLPNPPVTTAPNSRPASQGPPHSQDKVRSSMDVDSDIPINPARAALIGVGDSRDAPSRPPHDSHGRDRAPRRDSPRRSDRVPTPSGPSDAGRDERDSRHRHTDPRGSSRETHDAHPTHPRSERPSDRETDRHSDRSRDASSHRGSLARPADHTDHSRVSQQDPNYGRLNAIPSTADLPAAPPPSGPRGRGGGRTQPSRVVPANGPLHPTQQPAPSVRADGRLGGSDTIRNDQADRQPPTGPSSGRTRRGQHDGNNGNMNPPTAAAPPTMAPAIHPDRLRAINPSLAAPTTPSGLPDRPNAPTGPSSVGTPDRGPNAAGPPGSRPTPSNLPHTPHGDGPRQHQTPTGPASNDSRSGPGSHRQLRGIQNMLTQAQADIGGNARGAGGLRGRTSASRINLAGSDAMVLTGSSPITTPVQERSDPVRRDTQERPSRPEPIQTVSDSRAPNGYDTPSGRVDHERGSSRREHRSDRSDRGDRSGRPSRRSSRERTPGRGEREREARPEEPREHRDRRSGAGGPPPSGPGASHNPRDVERDQGPPRRSGRESMPSSREPLPPQGRGDPNRDPINPSRESSHRSHRGENGPGGSRQDQPPPPPPPPGRPGGHPRGDEYGSSSRGGPRGGGGGGGSFRESRSRADDRLEPPMRDDRSRKRRSDEGAGQTGGERGEKRPRR
ncbi:transcription factor/nuclear export subunit protein 2-domain-containing protein [Coniochaeta sp. 2T2.1]|nr:transcription factor/nuclear export subunit protein 2-domain-containing protein [Coniochaeta sp. 2T2.1]